MNESPDESLIFHSEPGHALSLQGVCVHLCVGGWENGVLEPVSAPGCRNFGWRGHCWVLGALARLFSSPAAQWHSLGELFKIKMPTPRPSTWGWTWASVFLLFIFRPW